MAPKRKADVAQPSLEEVVERPVTKVKTRGKKKFETEEGDTEDLILAKMARKHGNDPAFQKKQERASEAAPKSDSKAAADDGSDGAKPDFIDINRAPVLTLWVTAVAQRQNYSRNSALTFGKAIAGLMANAKGRSIGVIAEKEPPDEEAKQEKQSKEAELGVQRQDVFGMQIKTLTEEDEPRALDSGGSGNKAIVPAKVQQYLSRAFGTRLSDIEEVMKELAASFSAEEIGNEAYHLYEQFRPSVVQGQQGWGKKGRLEFDRIRELKK